MFYRLLILISVRQIRLACWIFFSNRLALLLFVVKIVPPNVILPSVPVLRVLPGYKLYLTATGSPPIYTALIRNSTVLVNSTRSTVVALLVEGNYTCVATNKYGTFVRKYSVIFIGKNTFFIIKTRVIKIISLHCKRYIFHMWRYRFRHVCWQGCHVSMPNEPKLIDIKSKHLLLLENGQKSSENR